MEIWISKTDPKYAPNQCFASSDKSDHHMDRIHLSDHQKLVHQQFMIAKVLMWVFSREFQKEGQIQTNEAGASPIKDDQHNRCRINKEAFESWQSLTLSR